MVRTDHILFIASGAFHIAKPFRPDTGTSGRFPSGRADLSYQGKILSASSKSPKRSHSPVQGLLETEEVELVFDDEAIGELAEIAYQVNSRTENIGARRLHTIMEKLSPRSPSMHPG